MSPVEIGAEALGAPDSAVISVALLRDGLTNDSWLVRTASDAVVVRINNPNGRVLHVDRNAEQDVLRVVAAAGIGPEVLLCDPKRHVLVTRYLGLACIPEDMHEPERIARMGRLLRRLHALAPPSSLSSVRWHEVIDDYVATLATMNRATALLDEEVKARGVAMAVEIESTSRSRCLCHNDVHYLNVIDAGELKLLDWEYAGVGDPYFDLASVAFYNDLSMDERALLLRAYEGEVDATAMQRLAKACVVFEYVHDLWHEVRASVGPGV